MHRYLFVFVVALLSAQISAETVFVHSAKAPLLLEPAFNSEQLRVLEKGAELQLLEQQRRWLKVALDGDTGWVSALLVKAEPPLDSLTLIGSDAVTLEGDARRRASAVATAGATRGLTEGADSEGLASDYEELAAMESMQVAQSVLDEFGMVLGGLE